VYFSSFSNTVNQIITINMDNKKNIIFTFNLRVLLTIALRAMVKEAKSKHVCIGFNNILTFKKLNLSLFAIFQYYISIFIPLSNAPRAMVSILLNLIIAYRKNKTEAAQEKYQSNRVQ